MLRKLLIAMAALATVGVFTAAPTLVTPQALAETPKCKNKANKYVACTEKLKAKTQTKPAKANTKAIYTPEKAY
jgi:hypothetical protein